MSRQSSQDMEGYAVSKLEQRLIRAIESGELPQSAPILSNPRLAKRFAISIPTAQRVLQKLAQEGYLVRQHGKRTLVADRARGYGCRRGLLAIRLVPGL